MPTSALFAEVAALSGDPGRANMLHALMDGRALTATELARVAAITPQTASGHLNRMTAAGLLVVRKQGRHRYFQLATASVARMLESIMQVAAELAPNRRHLSVGPKDLALRKARTCYDHFAGQLGVALADALIAHGRLELAEDAGIITETGLAFLAEIGIDPDRVELRRSRRSGRVFCRPCLDWSERRPHLGGAIGAAICAHSMQHGWTRRIEGTRAVLVTTKGRAVFAQKFGMRDLAG
ncbi:MAG TPA: winged helix-turn-helix domain-containing protein [Hyphomicrobiaceae bacterium]|jgi:DNA-binding transcriptional ArsR family regulator|nr:winged helix-turn-helix domain-containing protein [Hyphomicrobiaceae bacterium]